MPVSNPAERDPKPMMLSLRSGVDPSKTWLAHVTNFINAFGPVCCEAEINGGPRAEVLCAQSAVETAWGKAVLFVKDAKGNRIQTNNYFNIKYSSSWKGAVGTALVPEYDTVRGWYNIEQRFRIYDSASASMADYLDLIKSLPRYAPAWAVRGDPVAYARSIQACGYATAPTYSEIIIAVMKSIIRQQS